PAQRAARRLGGWTRQAQRPTSTAERVADDASLASRATAEGAAARGEPGKAGVLPNQQLEGFGVRSRRLLGLWNDDPDTAEVSVRVVRPIGTWKYGGPARVDIDFTLPVADEALKDLQFWPDDVGVEVDLPFEDDLPDVEDEGDGS